MSFVQFLSIKIFLVSFIVKGKEVEETFRLEKNSRRWPNSHEIKGKKSLLLKANFSINSLIFWHTKASVSIRLGVNNSSISERLRVLQKSFPSSPKPDWFLFAAFFLIIQSESAVIGNRIRPDSVTLRIPTIELCNYLSIWYWNRKSTNCKSRWSEHKNEVKTIFLFFLNSHFSIDRQSHRCALKDLGCRSEKFRFRGDIVIGSDRSSLFGLPAATAVSTGIKDFASLIFFWFHRDKFRPPRRCMSGDVIYV